MTAKVLEPVETNDWASLSVNVAKMKADKVTVCSGGDNKKSILGLRTKVTLSLPCSIFWRSRLTATEDRSCFQRSI